MASHARLTEMHEIAPDVLQLQTHLVDPPALQFRAGQFVSLLVPTDDGAERKRPYSIASSPDRTDGFELLAKLVPGGLASEWLRARGPGDDLPFVGPVGQFRLRDRHAGDIVFAVTGTGSSKSTCCQPDGVSPAKVAVANRVPVLVHRLPMCVPVLFVLL